MNPVDLLPPPADQQLLGIPAPMALGPSPSAPPPCTASAQTVLNSKIMIVDDEPVTGRRSPIWGGRSPRLCDNLSRSWAAPLGVCLIRSQRRPRNGHRLDSPSAVSIWAVGCPQSEV